MAMDALKNLTNNIPAWQRRLEELSSQIDKRQVDLAVQAGTKPPGADARCLRNKGSTESLKPTDDTATPHAAAPAVVEDKLEKRQGASKHLMEPILESSLCAPDRPAKVKKRTASVASVEEASRPAACRHNTRSTTVTVYYDSFVQAFFDDMVRFISSSRNHMRKAKMAAKVAQIKRLAEQDSPEDDVTAGEDRNMMETLPSLRLISSRRHGAGAMRFGPHGLRNGPPDVYDELDRALEFVQSTCEHGAHQFLRDANCTDELNKIRTRMMEVLDMAEKEAERVLREEPDLAKESGDLNKPRTRRPITMSRNLIANHNKESKEDHSSPMEVADSVRGSPLLRNHHHHHQHHGGHMEVDYAAGLEGDVDLPRMPAYRRSNFASSRQRGIVTAE